MGMGGLRVPVFLVAVVLAAVVVLIELGSLALPQAAARPGSAVDALCAASDAEPPPECGSSAGRAELALQVTEARASQPPTPGLAIPYLVLVDGLVFFVVGMMALSIVVPPRLHGRLQGLAGLIVSILLILAAILMIFVALGLLILMISLLLAVPFGTLAYLAIWGFFDRAGAAVALSLIMLLKVAFAVCLAIAHQSFLTDKGMLVLVAASLIANVIVAFLHGLVPGFLVSITDAVAAIVVAIIGILLAVLALAGSLVSVVRAVRLQA